MIDGMNEYLDYLRAEYLRWSKIRTDGIGNETRERMAQQYADGLTVVYGSKYAKVIMRSGTQGQSVHSFVCMCDMGKFTKGDILKAAGWAAPAKNFERGNVIARRFGAISWPGA